MIRSTHTYATLEISAAAYDEIALKLRNADYDHSFNHFDEANGAPTIDMQGIGLQRAVELAPAPIDPTAIIRDLVTDTIEDGVGWNVEERRAVKAARAYLAGQGPKLRPQLQAYRHNPAAGVFGDCERTAYAVLLGIDRDQVPHWQQGVTDEDMESRKRCDRERRAWLAKRGLGSMQMLFGGSESGPVALEAVLTTMSNLNGDDFCYLLTGASRNGTNHVVVCRGGAIICDPSLDASGIVGPAKSESGPGYWVEFIVPAWSRQPLPAAEDGHPNHGAGEDERKRDQRQCIDDQPPSQRGYVRSPAIDQLEGPGGDGGQPIDWNAVQAALAGPPAVKGADASPGATAAD